MTASQTAKSLAFLALISLAACSARKNLDATVTAAHLNPSGPKIIKPAQSQNPMGTGTPQWGPTATLPGQSLHVALKYTPVKADAVQKNYSFATDAGLYKVECTTLDSGLTVTVFNSPGQPSLWTEFDVGELQLKLGTDQPTIAPFVGKTDVDVESEQFTDYISFASADLDSDYGIQITTGSQSVCTYQGSFVNNFLHLSFSCTPIVPETSLNSKDQTVIYEAQGAISGDLACQVTDTVD